MSRKEIGGISVKNELKNLAIKNGDRLSIISIEYLKELENSIKDFKEKEELNPFQLQIVNKLYQFGLPKEEFEIRSIILVAVHHPFYAEVDFIVDGKKRTFLSVVPCDFNKTEKYLNDFIKKSGNVIKKSKNLPLKRLASQCGLANYGRNNITYVEGLGSNFSYVAYFSDLINQEDTWGEMKNAKKCENCNMCVEICPTGAIRKERFLIDNQRCLTYMNEEIGIFPDWIPMNAHNALYDCLMCQRICPMNQKQIDSVLKNISFTEEETKMLLEGKLIDTLSEEIKSKLDLLGVTEFYEIIPRNLKKLLEQTIVK